MCVFLNTGELTLTAFLTSEAFFYVAKNLQNVLPLKTLIPQGTNTSRYV